MNDYIEQRINKSLEEEYQQILETIILNYSNTKPEKELFKRLKLDVVFKVVKDITNFQAIEILYNNKYLPCKLNLYNFSVY